MKSTCMDSGLSPKTATEILLNIITMTDWDIAIFLMRVPTGCRWSSKRWRHCTARVRSNWPHLNAHTLDVQLMNKRSELKWRLRNQTNVFPALEKECAFNCKLFILWHFWFVYYKESAMLYTLNKLLLFPNETVLLSALILQSWKIS